MSSKTLSCVFLVAVALGCPGGVAAQELLDMARRHAKEYPGAPVNIPSAPGHHTPKTIDELTNEAVAVVQATLSRIRTYVGGSRGHLVLTDYVLTSPTLLSGGISPSVSAVPGRGTTPILITLGGEVVLEGVTVRYTDVNRAPIKDNTEYLLFLRSGRGPDAGLGRYEIYYDGIFEVSQEQLKPLLNKGDEIFPEFVQQEPHDVVARIRKAAQVPARVR
jgi:hypothetical protein